MSTEIRLKRFDKCSFNCREVEKSSSLGKDREFVITVLAGTGRVFQKMLFNGRVISNNLRTAIFLAGMGKIRAILERMMVSDRNMLFNVFLQPLGCTSYLLISAVAHKLIDNIIVVMGT